MQGEEFEEFAYIIHQSEWLNLKFSLFLLAKKFKYYMLHPPLSRYSVSDVNSFVTADKLSKKS